MRTLALLAIAPLVLLAGCGDSGSDGTTVDAVVNVSPPAGTVITDFVFDASGSTTGSRDLEFRWDWNGDGTWDTDWSADALVSHRFAEGGSLSVYIEVTDGSDSDIATVPVLVDAAHQPFRKGAGQRELLAIFHRLDQLVERKAVAEHGGGAVE